MRARFKTSAIMATLLLALAPACGDDDGGETADAMNNNTADAMNNNNPDAMQVETCTTDLAPTGDTDLVMSEISPGNYIELYNAGSTAVDLSTVSHQLCSPFAYAGLSNLAPEKTIQPGGFATVPWPPNFSDNAAMGQVMLYVDSRFDNDSSIIDFVCWGSHGPARQPQAEAVGEWSGGCAPALTNGSIHRNMASAGTTASDYDSTAAGSPVNCSQP